MAKLFEKIDDNPGAYFGMLAEGWEDLAYDDEVPGYEPKKRTWTEERYDELMNKGQDNWDRDDWDSYNYIMQVWGELGYFDESLNEDKFISRDKMSKKDRKELDSKKRNTWGNTNPVTKVQPNKKAYDRKRDKKELDEDIIDDNDFLTNAYKNIRVDDIARNKLLEEIPSLEYIVDYLEDVIGNNESTVDDLDGVISDLSRFLSYLKVLKRDLINR